MKNNTYLLVGVSLMILSFDNIIHGYPGVGIVFSSITLIALIYKMHKTINVITMFIALGITIIHMLIFKNFVDNSSILMINIIINSFNSAIWYEYLLQLKKFKLRGLSNTFNLFILVALLFIIGVPFVSNDDIIYLISIIYTLLTISVIGKSTIYYRLYLEKYLPKENYEFFI